MSILFHTGLYFVFWNLSSSMAKNYVRDNVPLSRFGVLVAQLESIVASAPQQSPDPLLCFDLLSDLISAIEEEPKVSLRTLCNAFFDLFLCLITKFLCDSGVYFVVAKKMRGCIIFIACSWGATAGAPFGFGSHGEDYS